MKVENDMKCIVSIILLSTLLCTMMAVCVSSATPYSVSRMCTYCNTSKALSVSCGIDLNKYDSDISCSLESYHGQGCMITLRRLYSSYAVCTNPDCEKYDNPYKYDEHVQTCYHTGNKTSYTVCNY